MKQIAFNNTNCTTSIPTNPNTVTMGQTSQQTRKQLTQSLLQNTSPKKITTKYYKHSHPTSVALKRHSPSTPTYPIPIKNKEICFPQILLAQYRLSQKHITMLSPLQNRHTQHTISLQLQTHTRILPSLDL